MSYNNKRALSTMNDLDKYEKFCVEFGYKFDETSLYNMKRYVFQQFNKYRNGKNAKDQWSFDARRFKRYIGEPIVVKPRTN